MNPFDISKMFSSTVLMETIHGRIKCQCFCVLYVDVYQLVAYSSLLCTALVILPSYTCFRS